MVSAIPNRTFILPVNASTLLFIPSIIPSSHTDIGSKSKPLMPAETPPLEEDELLGIIFSSSNPAMYFLSFFADFAALSKLSDAPEAPAERLSNPL